MRIVLFCHSLVSDWNHGNAHFLRGVVRELMSRGHDVRVFEAATAEVAAARARIPSLQHGRRFEMLEPMAEPTHLHVVGGPA